MRHADFYSHTCHQKFLNDLVDPLKSRGAKPAPRKASAEQAKAPAVGGLESVPRKMASNAPPATRTEVERVFTHLLAEYPKFERQSGFPANDMGGAVALFVAGSWMAYRDRDVPEEQFPILAAQMRDLIASNALLAGASPLERREMYEQMAVLGLYMTLTRMGLKRTPNPAITANMRTAGKRYLEDFLETDPERIQITAQGLVIN